MISRALPLEDLAQLSIMYWLPPGGQDNGVWATRWVIIAELDARDVTPIMLRMADADVGAYAARPMSSGGRRLYVDVEQYNRALDVLMVFLRGAPSVAPPAVPRRSATVERRRRIPPMLRRVLNGVGVALFIATMLGLAYLAGARWIAELHPPAPSIQVHSPNP